MISIKKFLDSDQTDPKVENEQDRGGMAFAAVTAYRSALVEMGNCSLEACPGLGSGLKENLDKLGRKLLVAADYRTLQAADSGVREQLRGWGQETARHYLRKSDEVRDLLILMARLAESVGNRDERCAGQIRAVTAALTEIASLEDLTEIRASIVRSAEDLKSSIDQMESDGKVAMHSLRLQVASYRSKLEQAEQLAFRDALTGVRSRLCIEHHIERQIADCALFCVAVVDIVDSWLPDLDLTEFLSDFRGSFPQVDVIATGGSSSHESPRGPYRQELLYALRRCQDTDTAAWNTAPATDSPMEGREGMQQDLNHVAPWPVSKAQGSNPFSTDLPTASSSLGESQRAKVSEYRDVLPTQQEKRIQRQDPAGSERLPELVGEAPCMLEVSRRIRLVAPRLTPVLIEGPTGSGKELVAEALHRLSTRSRKPFVAINCAAIPEALLEAELFGHTRGAFTGAVHGRVGRIEAADGGTLFLDEIGEMPLALQSKLLRFVECGELQRVGDNETVKVDVRIVAATHRPLAQHAATGNFRSDLYYRLAVFLIRTPALAEHSQDLPGLVEHFMQRLGKDAPVKRLDSSAFAKLTSHYWPGNVRELEHVLERAVILAGNEPTLTAQEIDFGFAAV